MKSSKPAPWVFGEFELDPTENVLRRNGQPVRLGHQPLRALTLLVSRGGAMVTREELREHIWGGRVNVDFEHGLNVCIRQIRVALDEEADAAHTILTVPRVGYRVNVLVSRGSSQHRSMKPLRMALTATAVAAGLTISTYPVMHWLRQPAPRSQALNVPAEFEPGTRAATAPAGIGFTGPNPRNAEAAALLWRGRAIHDSDSRRQYFGRYGIDGAALLPAGGERRRVVRAGPRRCRDCLDRTGDPGRRPSDLIACRQPGGRTGAAVGPVAPRVARRRGRSHVPSAR